MIERIIGPPGCGKTFAILERIDEACRKYFPEQVGACSLTNTAVNEMKQRIISTTNIDANAVQNVNTIHGMCFKLLDMNKKEVAEPRMGEFITRFRQWDLTPSACMTVEGDFAFGAGQDMPIMNQIQVYRQRLINPMSWEREPALLWADWNTWLTDNCLIDFTGMLEKVLLEELVPNVSILFVDEAQDMSPLQNAIARMWGSHIDDIVFSGDANQAIFRFAGSEPSVFKNLSADCDKETILSQSYRVPQVIVDLSNKLLAQATDREDIIYFGRKNDGEPVSGHFHGVVSEPDFSLPGTHMIIARCRYRVDEYLRYLYDFGMPFHNPFRPSDRSWNPMNNQIFTACRTFKQIAQGVNITGLELKTFVKKTISKGNLKRGLKTKIADFVKNRELYDIFDLTEMGFADHIIDGTASFLQLFGTASSPSETLAYSLFDSPQLFDDPRVIVGTIHSVKGGEADHVWIDDIIPRTIASEMSSSIDAFNDEVRCGYVALTRARSSVGILNSGRGIHNEIYEVL